jgi:hypothetical protein
MKVARCVQHCSRLAVQTQVRIHKYMLLVDINTKGCPLFGR